MDGAPGTTTLAFMALGFFAFAWTVRLGFQVRKSVRDHSDHLHDRIDELEQAAVEVQKDINSLSSDLAKKVDADYVEKRVAGLVQLIEGSK